MILQLILRWIHVFSAITLAGGIFFMRFALFPGTSALSVEEQDRIRQPIRSLWSKCVMATSLFLIVSGIVNIVLIFKAKEVAPGTYHALFGIKLLLALAIFWIAAVLSGKSSTAQKFREKESFWLNVLVALTVATVCVAGAMKMTPRNAPNDEETSKIYRNDDSVASSLPAGKQAKSFAFPKMNNAKATIIVGI